MVQGSDRRRAEARLKMIQDPFLIREREEFIKNKNKTSKILRQEQAAEKEFIQKI